MIDEVQMSLGDNSAKFHVVNECAQSAAVAAIKAQREFIFTAFGVRSLSFEIDDGNGTLNIHFFADGINQVCKFLKWVKTVGRITGDWKQTEDPAWTVIDDDGTGSNSVVWRDTLKAARRYIEKGYA